MSGPEARYTNLYMKNLDPDITEALLQEKFSSFGKIVSLAVAKDINGTSKGFGFVNFENPDDAKRALEAMNGMQLGSLFILLTLLVLGWQNLLLLILIQYIIWF